MDFLAHHHPRHKGLMELPYAGMASKLHGLFVKFYKEAQAEGMTRKDFFDHHHKRTLMILQLFSSGIGKMAHDEFVQLIEKKKWKIEELDNWIKRFKHGLSPAVLTFDEVAHIVEGRVSREAWETQSVPQTVLDEIEPPDMYFAAREVFDWMKSYVTVYKWHKDAKERYEWSQANQAWAAELNGRGLYPLARALDTGAVRYLHHHAITPTVEIPLDHPHPTSVIGDLGLRLDSPSGTGGVFHSDGLVLFQGDRPIMTSGISLNKPNPVPVLRPLWPFSADLMSPNPFVNIHPTEKDLQAFWIVAEYDPSRRVLILSHVFQGGVKKRTKSEVWRPEDRPLFVRP